MKKSLSVLFLCLLLLCGLAVPAFAAEEEDIPVDSEPVEDAVEAPMDDSSSYDFPTTTVEEGISGSVFNFDLNFNGAVPPVEYVSTELEPLPDTPREGLVGVVSALFGSYEPLTYTVDTVIDGVVVDTDVQCVPGLAGLDYEWLAGVALFSILLYCFLRMVGGVLK